MRNGFRIFCLIVVFAIATVFEFSDEFGLEPTAVQAERAKAYRSKGRNSGRPRKGVKARNRRSGRGGSSGIPTTQSNFCSNDFNFVLDHPRARASQGCNFKIATDFKTALENDLKACLKSASEEMGWGTPTFMTIKHDGCYVPRNVSGSRTISSHATARGLDINEVELQFVDGDNSRTENVSFTKQTKHPKYYSLVRECWGSKNSCNRSIGFKGSRSVKNGISNSDHNDHLHISKTCPPSLRGHSSY